MTDDERKGACKKAKQIVGVKYDVNFRFDSEQELKHYTGKNKTDAKAELVESQQHIKNMIMPLAVPKLWLMLGGINGRICAFIASKQ